MEAGDAPGLFREHVDGDCLSPVHIRTEGKRRGSTKLDIAVETWARCRKCGPCLNARRKYWAAAAHAQTTATVAAGRRSWFGTYTLAPWAHRMMLERARQAYPYAEPPFSSITNDERLRLVRHEIKREIDRMWARLRKKHKLRYFMVFERHLGKKRKRTDGKNYGKWHLHALIHEVDGPILKRQLQAEWKFGQTKINLVGGSAANAAAPERAAFYVAKYLAKDVESRPLASQFYRPTARR